MNYIRKFENRFKQYKQYRQLKQRGSRKNGSIFKYSSWA